jgi:hypothetical protein
MYLPNIGATKAKISAHFAVKDRLADVIAKESTQETAVGLVGMILGAICAKLIGSDLISNWVVFTILLLIHQWANYNLIKVLILDTVNPQRSMILTQELIFIRQQKNLLQERCSNDTVVSSDDSLLDSTLSININEQLGKLSPSVISRKENLFRPIYLSFIGPQIGCSLDLILYALNYCTVENDNGVIWSDLQNSWQDEKFIIGFDIDGRVCACLQEGSTEADEVKAYFLACYLQCIQTQNSSILMPMLSPKIDKKEKLLARYQNLLHHDAKDSLNWFNNCLEVKDHTDSSNSITTTAFSPGHIMGTAIPILSSDKKPKVSVNTSSMITLPPSQDLFQVLALCGWDGVISGKSRLGSGSWRYQCEENKKDK